MNKTAIIGGSGFDAIGDLQITARKVARTPYGDPSGIIVTGTLNENSYVFLPRHGAKHTIPPHKINYRANVWALKDSGVERIIALAAVGGIDSALSPGTVVIPDQLIDYTWGREHTFFDGESGEIHHIDFETPYSVSLRQRLIDAANRADIPVVTKGTYAVTQGPRFESPAEILKLERDGADIVGMTGMPEAALARELELNYACLALVVNPAAGKGDEPISLDEIKRYLEITSKKALEILRYLH